MLNLSTFQPKPFAVASFTGVSALALGAALGGLVCSPKSGPADVLGLAPT